MSDHLSTPPPLYHVKDIWLPVVFFVLSVRLFFPCTDLRTPSFLAPLMLSGPVFLLMSADD